VLLQLQHHQTSRLLLEFTGTLLWIFEKSWLAFLAQREVISESIGVEDARIALLAIWANWGNRELEIYFSF
jgi:hypothetical protein